MDKRQVYLDYNATTPLHPEVRRAMINAMPIFGNPSSLHKYGKTAKELLDEAHEQAAKIIGAEVDEIVFTGGGSEANNMVIKSVPQGKELIATSIEHPSILEPAKYVEHHGVTVKYLPVDLCGKVDLLQLENMLSSNTYLVSVMMVNNEIGTIQDLKAITKIAHKHGALVHTDAIQAVGKIPVDVKDLNIDFLTYSGHKFYGPKGCGLLYIRSGLNITPLIHGGHHEEGKRAGTENILGIVGLAKAAEIRMSTMAEEYHRILKLKHALQQGIEKTITDIKINSHPTDCVPHTLNISFMGAEGALAMLYLDIEGIAVSTGSACALGDIEPTEPTHVIKAISGGDAEAAHSSLRFSLGRNTTMTDIKYVLKVLPEIITIVRVMSSADLQARAKVGSPCGRCK